LDGEPFTAAILPPMNELATDLDVSLDLVGVVPPLFMPMNDEECRVPDWTLERLQVRHVGGSYVMLESKPEVQERLAALGESLDFWSRRLTNVLAVPRVHTIYGVHRPSLAGTIIQTAQQLEADLIALRTHARPSVERIVLGSVADEIVRTSPLPTLLFTSRSLGQADGVAVELAHHAIPV
jgi:nucleotide-binding universal stress UspA family protein